MSDNPYKTPLADVATAQEIKRSVFWKIYFVFIVVLIILSLLGIATDSNAGLAEVIDIFISIPSFIGFYGYVFSKKILARRIWFPVLILTLIWDVAYLYVTDLDFASGMDRETYFWAMGIGWILILPSYIALYLYARESNPVWHDLPGKLTQPEPAESGH